MVSSLLIFSKWGYYVNLVIRFLIGVTTLLYWVKIIKLEGLIGHHTPQIIGAFKIVFYLFLLRELIFFFAMFWGLFDALLVPATDLGEFWVPVGITQINPLGLPLLNSVLLLSRAVGLTIAHHQFLAKKNNTKLMLLTIFLGLLFILIQFLEYQNRGFRIRDGIFGSLFFILTGFHFIHVFLGLFFLTLNLVWLNRNQINNQHHLR